MNTQSNNQLSAKMSKNALNGYEIDPQLIYDIDEEKFMSTIKRLEERITKFL